MRFYSFIVIFLFASTCLAVGQSTNSHRLVTSLNGIWDFEVTNNPNLAPDKFSHTIPVPGLVDMAVPAIEKPGYKRDSLKYYWYRTKFKLSGNSPVCLLKIHKAQYGKKIFLNGKPVCEHYPSYTPAIIDIKKYVNREGEENNLVIRVGSYYNFPDSFVNGHDFEKSRFISGIYDDVEVIESSYPYIQNVQLAPDIHKGLVTVRVETDTKTKSGKYKWRYRIQEHKSGKLVADGMVENNATGFVDTTVLQVSMPGFRYWSPDDPFLYDLVLTTDGDQYKTRFGMREFRFDTLSGRAMLNNKVFYITGTSVPVFRFFEDSLRGNYPWDKQWVRKLNTQFKYMNWNVVRYHVGPAPDFWYDLADEMGILIQDEFSIWFGHGMKGIRPRLKARNIAAEYMDWMRERWNHPSVVIWDAQNETVSEETGKAINLVRHLDLSNRPWDNGWSRPQSPTDAIESHPYLFFDYAKKGAVIPEEGLFKKLMASPRQPYNDAGDYDLKPDTVNFKNIRFINEYGWIWVNRDGSATTLSEWLYKNLYGDSITNAQRLYYYARIEAMLTEYWRCNRICAGVMHFAGLTYSRPQEPRGQTSDNFKNLATLEFDDNFIKYVRPSFAQVALMINSWEKEYVAGQEIEVPVYVINDLYEGWSGKIDFTIAQGNKVVWSQSLDVSVKSLGREIPVFKFKVPGQAGNYEMKALLKLNNEEVFSVRDMLVK